MVSPFDASWIVLKEAFDPTYQPTPKTFFGNERCSMCGATNQQLVSPPSYPKMRVCKTCNLNYFVYPYIQRPTPSPQREDFNDKYNPRWE